MAKVGDTIKIICMNDPYAGVRYTGKTGIVEHIDSIGQLHGTWEGLALIPGKGNYIVINSNVQ